VATFVDTNVLVYAVDRADKRKNRIARTVLAESVSHFVISSQVLNEYYVAVTRKLEPPLPESTAAQTVRQLARGRVVSLDAELVLNAVDVCITSRLSIWDALIVSAAKKAGCQTLLTEDLNDGQVIEGITVKNPFKEL
jgi:predicted nucleic acid-binding protein